MLVRDPLCGAMHLITPSVYKRFSAPVQFFHCRKRISLYELLLQVVEGRFDFAFFTGPVTGARVQFRPKMPGHHQRLWVVADFVLAFWMVLNHQRFGVVNQQFQGNTTQIVEQLLDGFIDRCRIDFQGETDGLLSGCRQYHCEAVHFPLPVTDHHGILRPVELRLVTGRCFDADGCLGTDQPHIFIHPLKKSVNGANAARVAFFLQLPEDARTVEFVWFTSPLNNKLLILIQA